jgi:hypothetical protein
VPVRNSVCRVLSSRVRMSFAMGVTVLSVFVLVQV